MSKRIEAAEQQQATMARAILNYASDDHGVYHLTDEKRREVRAGLAEIERGDVASDAEVTAVYKRIGLWRLVERSPGAAQNVTASIRRTIANPRDLPLLGKATTSATFAS